MKLIKTNTKIYAGVLLIGLMVLLATISIQSLTRTISDSQDTIETFIKTSDGNIYAANYANLQTALNLGGEILLPECNITMSTTGLTMSVDGTRLIGRGEESQLYLLAGSTYRNMINVTAEDCTIENIRFDVNNGSQTMLPTTIRAIYLDVGSYRCTVRHCSFYRGSYTLIGSASSSLQGSHLIEENYIDGKQYTGYGSGITMRGANNIIRNNRIKDTYAAGITLEGATWITNNNLIEGNIVSGYISVGIYMEDGGGSCNATIVNNVVYAVNCTAYAGFPDGTGILGSDYALISNNYIYYPYGYGIACDDHCTISDNIIYDVTKNVGYGIRADAFCTIADNKIINRYRGGTNQPDYGITCGEGCIITGNNISASNGITFEFGIETSGSHSIISDNTLNGCLVGIRINGGDYCQVDNNHLQNCGGSFNSALYISNSVFTHITNNQIYSSYWGIRLKGSYNCTVIGNTVESSQANDAIFEDTTGDYNLIINNNLRLSSGTVTVLGSSTRVNMTGLDDWNLY